MEGHDNQILDQFTKQAALFESSHRSAETAIDEAIRVSEVQSDDTVLDVACGPGILACAFANAARHVTGIDITPTMLERAKKLAAESGLTNIDWQLGDVSSMPFEDDAFSMVISRYAFHHFERPDIVLTEMTRVCRSGGAIVIIDSAPAAEKAAAFNEVERCRDPSHTCALTADETSALVAMAGLQVSRRHLYAWDVTADSLVQRSFPTEIDRSELQRRYEADIGIDRMGMDARRVDGVVYLTFPTLITVAQKP